MIRIEERPPVTYSHIGGCREQIEKLRTVEKSVVHYKFFAVLDIVPPRGVLLVGPPRSGKCLCARAYANSTGACFIKVIGSELAQTAEGSLSLMIRNLFNIARTVQPCVIFFDEIDVIAGTRFGNGPDGENEMQKAVLELIKQIKSRDIFNIKVLMATKRLDTLDPALIHPTCIERTVEFDLPDLESRVQIFKIYASPMILERGIRFEMLARLCPNTTAIDIMAMCTAAGRIAIFSRCRVTENHFLEGVQKVINFYGNVSTTPRYRTYNRQFLRI